MTEVSFVEFSPDDPAAVVAAMDELASSARGDGWITFDPALDDDFPPPVQTSFGRLLSGRGPAVPRATWVPADRARRRPEPVSLGILHGTGAKALARLGEAGIALPDRWRKAADHAKRGVVVHVPIDVPAADVLAWLLPAARHLTRVPLQPGWRAAIHRR